MRVYSSSKVKQPREFGVVSLHSKRKHAFALGRVLLGIYASYLPSSSEEIISVLQKLGIQKSNDNTLKTIKVNLVYAVTLGGKSFFCVCFCFCFSLLVNLMAVTDVFSSLT